MFTSRLLLLIALFSTLTLSAQHTLLRGTVVGAKDRRPIEMATVRLLQLPDSTLLDGATTDTLGAFALTAARSGSLLLKVSYVGFPTLLHPVTVRAAADTLDLGALLMQTDDIALRAAVVKTTLARVEQKEDTTVFNAAAFRTAEGSTLEALVKQLPGAEVADDGTIKVNGKTVKEFLINGKDFFKGDTKVAMKNLPTDLVSKIKTYDKKSDYAEQTGIDDGEESFVLDITTKREMNQSLISNIDLGAGWDYADKRLYSGRVFLSRFTDRSRYTFFASHNNVGDNSFGGPRGFVGNNGITTSSMVGGDFSWENGRKRMTPGYFEMGGNLLYFRSDNNTESTTASETFLNTAARQSFAAAHRWDATLTQRVHSRFRIQWNPDSLTTLSFRPSFNWTRGNTSSTSRTATFDDDPFARYAAADTDGVLEQAFRNAPVGTSIATTDDFLVNLNHRNALGQNSTTAVEGNLELTRRLGAKAGRNVSFSARAGTERSSSFSYAKADIYTRRSGLTAAPYWLDFNGTHQFADNTSKAWNYRLGLSYVEPLVGKLLGEVRYNYEHKFTDSDRSLYNLYALDGYNTLADFMAHHTAYGSIANLYIPGSDALIRWMDPAQLLSTLSAADLQAAVRDDQNSQYATYTYDNHDAQLRLRYNTSALNLSAGLSFTPERTRLEYERPVIGLIDTVRTVFNVSPQVRLRYNISKTDRLEVFYRGSSSQPSMTNLLNVVDSSDPLNISVGNPGLKPAWSDRLRAFFNTYDAQRQQSIMAYANFSHTRNAISNLLVYDAASGRRFTRPENISGNWSAGAGVTFNTPLDSAKIFTLATSTNFAFNRAVGYTSATAATFPAAATPTLQDLNTLFASATAAKNVSRTATIGENLDLAYRRSFWDVALNGRVNYQHSRSSLRSESNLDTWTFSYGATANLNLSNGFSLSTDIRMQSRRGFSASAMNTNELLWNAQLSKSFLASRALSLSLRFYDILQQQSNISRSINAMMRTDSWNNAIHAYAMLHVIYKLNIFGGNKGAKHPDNDTSRPPMRPGGANQPMMPPPGGGGFRGGPGF